MPVDILEGFLLRSPESGLKFQAAFPPIGADADQVLSGAARRCRQEFIRRSSGNTPWPCGPGIYDTKASCGEGAAVARGDTEVPGRCDRCNVAVRGRKAASGSAGSYRDVGVARRCVKVERQDPAGKKVKQPIDRANKPLLAFPVLKRASSELQFGNSDAGQKQRLCRL